MKNKGVGKPTVAIIVVVIAIAGAAGGYFYISGDEGGGGGRVQLKIEDWPMDQQNPRHTGYTGSEGPDENALKWKFKTGRPAGMGPVVADGTVYIGSEDNYLYAINARTGKLEWKFKAGSSVRGACVWKSKVFAHSVNGYVFAVDEDTGEKVWKFEAGGGNLIVTKDGTLFIGGDNIYAVNAATGQQKWKYNTAGRVGTYLAVADNTVYAQVAGYIYLIDASTGEQKELFKTGKSLFGPPTVVDGVLYFGSGLGDDNVYAIDADTGELKWTFQITVSAYSIPAVGLDGTVYVTSNDNIYALNPDGSLKWTFKRGFGASVPAISSDGTLYVGNCAINASTGELKWKFNASGDYSVGSPAVVDGTVYLASLGGRYVYAIGQ